MSHFFFMIASGFVWRGLTADLDFESFIWGGAMGALIWFFLGTRSHRPFGIRRALMLIVLGTRLTGIFLWELTIANLQQLRLVLSPRIDIQPGWIELPCSLETLAMRALFGTMLTLTPGSLTYEESNNKEGQWMIRIHLLDCESGEAALKKTRRRFEEPLRRMEKL